jgi:hypothetical protein
VRLIRPAWEGWHGIIVYINCHMIEVRNYLVFSAAPLLLFRMCRWWFLILINLVLISLSFGEINLSNYPCYRPKPFDSRNARIVGGYNAIKGESPYMVVSAT